MPITFLRNARLFALSLILLTSAFAASPRCEFEKVVAIIQANEYVVDRGISNYLKRFSTLERELGRLTPDDHIIDGGSGDTLAMAEYLGLDPAPADGPKFRQRANVTAISYELDAKREQRLAASAKLNLITGKFLEKVPARDITGKFGKARLVTDFWGVLSYTGNLTGDLQKYVDCLKPGGKIFMTVGPEEFDYRSGFGRMKSKSSVYRSRVITKDGRDITVPEWIRSLNGIQIIEDGENLVLVVPDPGRVVIPKLRLVSVDDTVTKPPARYFREE